jgi:hypothetical protein
LLRTRAHERAAPALAEPHARRRSFEETSVARKDLSRTVIEGGRYYHNCVARRYSHRVARADQRVWLDAVRLDPDLADDGDVGLRPHVGRMFRDKLAPARRWLARQVGRPWDKVHSDLVARFDTRTVAGRHVVHDHMLAWVWRGDVSEREPYRQRDFVVDAHGTLRRGRWFDRGDYRRLIRETQEWRSGRRVVLTHRGWWWVRVIRRDALQPGNRSPLPDEGISGRAIAFAAERALTRGERSRLARLPDELRVAITIDPRRVAITWPARRRR